MNLLYKGGYAERFTKVTHLIDKKNVLELCFGDTRIAEFCRRNGIEWTGYDLSSNFVKEARVKKFNAHQANLAELTEFPSADICIICGSLCYFYPDLPAMLSKMLRASPKIIISEPVINLSAQKGLLGSLVRKMPFLEGSAKYFRFDEKSLMDALELYSKKLNFRYAITERFNKDMIVVLEQ